MVSKRFTAGPFRLRQARPEDADAIAALHVKVWRETYRDLATPEAYAALTEDVRRERWRETLAPYYREAGLELSAAGSGPGRWRASRSMVSWAASRGT